MGDHQHGVTVSGIGWLDGQAWGRVLRRETAAYGEGQGVPPWKQADLFGRPVKNLGRFNRVARTTISACALALMDAGVSCADEGEPHDIGLLGTNAAGCLEANRAYFQDYLAGGRTLARGNLFIYTLPSSPLAETAIHFGLAGPMLYVGYPGGGITAGGGRVADTADEEAALAVLLGRAEDCGHGVYEAVCTACAARERGEGWSKVALRIGKALRGSDGK